MATDVEAALALIMQHALDHDDWTWDQRAWFVVGAFIEATRDGFENAASVCASINEFLDNGSLTRAGWTLVAVKREHGGPRLDLRRVC